MRQLRRPEQSENHGGKWFLRIEILVQERDFELAAAAALGLAPAPGLPALVYLLAGRLKIVTAAVTDVEATALHCQGAGTYYCGHKRSETAN